MIIVLFLVLSAVYSQQWTSIITNDINRLRTEYGLPKIVYNYTLHEELIKIVNETHEGYYYEWNPDYCMNFPYSRKNCLRGYSLRPLGNHLIFHDTILFPSRIVRVLRQRIRQVKCMDQNKCSKDVFTNFISCAKDQTINYFYDKKCIYFYHYVPKMLLPELEYLACVILNYESGYSPIYQPYSFMCYSNANWYNRPNDLIN